MLYSNRQQRRHPQYPSLPYITYYIRKVPNTVTSKPQCFIANTIKGMHKGKSSRSKD